MIKHTPGPWIFEHRTGDHPLNDQDGWGCDGLWAVNGGFILGSGAGWDGTYQGPTEANAHLIAAAPEMADLLRDIAQLPPLLDGTDRSAVVITHDLRQRLGEVLLRLNGAD